MIFLTILIEGSFWWPVMDTGTTTLSYWFNWRVLLCALWILAAIMLAALLIWRYEGHGRNRASENNHWSAGDLYKDDVWRTCLTSVHPIWLLAYRVIAFCFLLALFLADMIISRGRKLYFYTQWTFTLVAFYFGLGSSLSLYGCLRYCGKEESNKDYSTGLNVDHESYVLPMLEENLDMPSTTGSLNHDDESNCRISASAWGYALQIVFQMCAGAVVLTDFVYWLIIYRYLTPRNYSISFLVVCMHSVNAILLLGDAILNRLSFPFFRVAYFILWTCAFIILQWIIHACVSLSWPYPFLDLSSPYAPLWYVAIGLLVFPCFAVFTLVFWIKRYYSSG